MRIIRAAIIGATCTLTMLTGVGMASAAVHAPASPRWISGFEHFNLVGASLNGNRTDIAAYGLFNARGVDHQISRHVDVFRFRNGSFHVWHKATHSRQHFSKVTCSGTFSERGVYRLGHGHGRYRGIRGHGIYQLHGLIVTRHTRHGCGHRPIAVHTVIHAHGPTSLVH
jgi:hypothetical protein